MIKIKIINHQVMAKYGDQISVENNNVQELEQYIKVFYNCVDAINPDIMLLLEEMNKTYVVSDEEL